MGDVSPEEVCQGQGGIDHSALVVGVFEIISRITDYGWLWLV